MIVKIIRHGGPVLGWPGGGLLMSCALCEKADMSPAEAFFRTPFVFVE